MLTSRPLGPSALHEAAIQLDIATTVLNGLGSEQAPGDFAAAQRQYDAAYDGFLLELERATGIEAGDIADRLEGRNPKPIAALAPTPQPPLICHETRTINLSPGRLAALCFGAAAFVLFVWIYLIVTPA
jgi:hypothetical protein